jgi:hypothetical protein
MLREMRSAGRKRCSRSREKRVGNYVRPYAIADIFDADDFGIALAYSNVNRLQTGEKRAVAGAISFDILCRYFL